VVGDERLGGSPSRNHVHHGRLDLNEMTQGEKESAGI
jgi:hypothetical protein